MNPMQMLMGLGGLGGLGGLMAQPKPGPKPDTAETIYISSLALLKMLKHSKAGVPLEVMGLMLGEFIDDYTIKCADVFSMPQSASGVRIFSFNTKILGR
jgi:26S proteasome regulatory subunit N11